MATLTNTKVADSAEPATQTPKAARVATIQYDIESSPCLNDPREWSSKKKWFCLLIIATAAAVSALSANIFFPALDALQRDLGVSDIYITSNVAIFILFQGTIPILWSTISEVKGRKLVYILSMTLYVTGSAVASQAQTGPVFFAMRIISAIGGSAVLSIGAGSLADIYASHERGRKLGIYYIAPLLGPSFGTLLGGALTSASDWRATFYFLTGYGGFCLLTFIFLPDTFRPQRSRAWVAAANRAAQQQERKAANGTESHELSPVTTHSQMPLNANKPDPIVADLPKLKLTIRDVNPLSAVGAVMKIPINSLATVFSGLLFAVQYSLSFTGARSFANAPYNFKALDVGLVLLSLGIGSIAGSVLGGRWSDRYALKQKARNDGVWRAEYRLLSTMPAMPFLPASLICYAWLVEETVHIGWICAALFTAGFSSIWIYSSTLAFLVDKNPGRSSSAVACNSALRGIFGCIAAFIAEPLTKSIGNGPLYSGWAVVIATCSVGLVYMSRKGARR